MKQNKPFQIEIFTQELYYNSSSLPVSKEQNIPNNCSNTNNIKITSCNPNQINLLFKDSESDLKSKLINLSSNKKIKQMNIMINPKTKSQKNINKTNPNIDSSKNVLNTLNENESSNKQFLPSEFENEWLLLHMNTIQEHFIDYFDSPYILFNLIQEMFSIINILLNDKISIMTRKFIEFLDIQKTESNLLYMDNFLHKIFIDLYDQIFENDSFLNKIYKDFIEKYLAFYNKNFGVYKIKEFNEIFVNSSFKICIKKIIKIIMYVKLHKNIQLNDMSFEKRNFSVQNICVNSVNLLPEKLQKNKEEKKNCVILLSPPHFKNKKSNFYRNLKPIALEVDNNYNLNNELLIINNNNKKGSSANNINNSEKIKKIFINSKNNFMKHKIPDSFYGKFIGNFNSPSKSNLKTCIKKHNTNIRMYNLINNTLENNIFSCSNTNSSNINNLVNKSYINKTNDINSITGSNISYSYNNTNHNKKNNCSKKINYFSSNKKKNNYYKSNNNTSRMDRSKLGENIEKLLKNLNVGNVKHNNLKKNRNNESISTSHYITYREKYNGGNNNFKVKVDNLKTKNSLSKKKLIYNNININ